MKHEAANISAAALTATPATSPKARSSERAPSAGLEPAHTAPEADALSSELRGLTPKGSANATARIRRSQLR